MPLLDHFRPSLEGRRHWEAFHAAWSAMIAGTLNRRLPQEHYAEPQVHHGPRIEVDVATWEEAARGGVPPEPPRSSANGGTAVEVRTEIEELLEPADLVLPATFPPTYGVQVYSGIGGQRLVAAVELVSPAKKVDPRLAEPSPSSARPYCSKGSPWRRSTS